jgi:anti-sigma B factor antagonist
MSVQPLVFRRLSAEVLLAPPALGLVAVPDLLRHVEAAFQHGGRRLVVDLSEVGAMDSTALRALVWAGRYARTRNGELGVVPPPDGVLREAEAALVHHLFPVYADRDAAARSPREGVQTSA